GSAAAPRRAMRRSSSERRDERRSAAIGGRGTAPQRTLHARQYRWRSRGPCRRAAANRGAPRRWAGGCAGQREANAGPATQALRKSAVRRSLRRLRRFLFTPGEHGLSRGERFVEAAARGEGRGVLEALVAGPGALADGPQRGNELVEARPRLGRGAART